MDNNGFGFLRFDYFEKIKVVFNKRYLKDFIGVAFFFFNELKVYILKVYN